MKDKAKEEKKIVGRLPDIAPTKFPRLRGEDIEQSFKKFRQKMVMEETIKKNAS